MPFKIKYILFSIIIIIEVIINSQLLLSKLVLNEISSLDINQTDLSKLFPSHTIEFYTKCKTKIGKYRAIQLQDLIEGIIPKNQSLKNIIVCMYSSTDTIINSYYEYKTNLHVLCPILILNEVTSKVGEIVTIKDKTKQVQVDLAKVQIEYEKIIEERYYLQINKLTKDEKNNFFSKYSVIYPQDKSTERWIQTISYIKIYQIKEE